MFEQSGVRIQPLLKIRQLTAVFGAQKWFRCVVLPQCIVTMLKSTSYRGLTLDGWKDGFTGDKLIVKIVRNLVPVGEDIAMSIDDSMVL